MKRLIHRKRWGLLLNWRAAWIGVHGSEQNGRVCINIVPCVTVWVCRPGGKQP